MIISLISILTINNVIGRKNDIPWYFPVDMQWFKYHTLGKPIIMGRKTFESIAKKPLVGRLNIILSNQLHWYNRWTTNNTVYIVDTPEKALYLVKESNEVMVIGGSMIYNIFLPKSTRMYLTYINCTYQYGDAWFPKYNQNEWKSIFDFCTLYNVYKKNRYNLCFKILERC